MQDRSVAVRFYDMVNGQLDAWPERPGRPGGMWSLRLQAHGCVFLLTCAFLFVGTGRGGISPRFTETAPSLH